MSKNGLVSIIITTRNEEQNIEWCLRSIKDQSYSNIEIIVVDNTSSDNTKKIARKYTKYVYNKGPERSSQRNFGVQKAHGKFVLIVDADMILSPDLVDECVRLCNSSHKVALIIPEVSYGDGFWAKCKSLERSYYVGIDWMEAARFFNKDIFLATAGYDENMTGPEDYDFSQRVMDKYGENKIGRVQAWMYHNEGKLSFFRSLKKKYYYGKSYGIYLKNSTNHTYIKKQSNIIGRYALFFSKKIQLKNIFVFIGMLFFKISEILAFGAGWTINKIRLNIFRLL